MDVALCKICGAIMDDDPESLHLNCGGDCRWCMAIAGDPDCRESVIDLMRRDCLKDMTDVFQIISGLVAEVGGDTELFGMQILEQWRPW